MGELTDRRLGTQRYEIERITGAEAARVGDLVAREEPLEIRLAFDIEGRRTQRSVSVTMRTPGNDEELAVGFLFTEGIVGERRDVVGVGPFGAAAPNGLVNVVRVDLAAEVAVDLARLERHFYTSSSCGVCGKASLDAVAVNGRFEIAEDVFQVSREMVGRLPAALRERQTAFAETGGLHASGLFTADGLLECVREDVGRHNALDKLIGRALLEGRLPLAERGILVSGRASFELVQKAMVAGCPLLAAVGAPSSLAIDLASRFGMTLIGFLRPDRFNVYTGAQRVH